MLNYILLFTFFKFYYYIHNLTAYLVFMTKQFFLLLILCIFFISLTTLFFIFHYLDPYRNEMISIFTITISFILCVTSFFTLFLYIFKKVYYRGEVFLLHIFSSLRQGFLLSIFAVGLILFHIIWVFSFATVALFILILIFMEMMFQNF